jgi:hypothetical protein
VIQPDGYVREALEHIRYLSQEIGGRGSCTHAERRAAEYAAEQMRAAGADQVQIQVYRAAPSTYRPYALAFGVALLGTFLVWILGPRLVGDAGGRVVMAVAALLSGLAAWGMLAESDLNDNWLRRLLPTGASVNAAGIVHPTAEVRRRVVLCAHLDTHRTPIFYSSQTWYRLFGLLVGGAFASMVLGAAVYLLGAVFGWEWVRWVGLAAAAVELSALALCLHADLTPFSPGANDDASGVGTVLALAHRLAAQPLAHTEVWLALTGCEEVDSYGMAAFLDAHAARLGRDVVCVILDQVGVGCIRYLTADGLIRKRRTHRRAVAIARQVSRLLPELEVQAETGLAYTDALVATKRGLIALTVDALPPPSAGDAMHWHRMSDTLDRLEPQALAGVHAFTWLILQEIDRS